MLFDFSFCDRRKMSPPSGVLAIPNTVSRFHASTFAARATTPNRITKADHWHTIPNPGYVYAIVNQ